MGRKKDRRGGVRRQRSGWKQQDSTSSVLKDRISLLHALTGREEGREDGKEVRREGGRDVCKEGGNKGVRKGGREGGREGGIEGGKVRK